VVTATDFQKFAILKKLSDALFGLPSAAVAEFISLDDAQAEFVIYMWKRGNLHMGKG
jgi:hypothetical protein